MQIITLKQNQNIGINNFSDDLLTVITQSQTSPGNSHHRWAFRRTCDGNSLDKSVIVWSQSANHLRSYFSSLLILKRLIFFQITHWSTGAAILDLSEELSFDWSMARLPVITWSRTGGFPKLTNQIYRSSMKWWENLFSRGYA